ncbi:MAG: hypothetical protein ACE5IA_03500, partial [Dehalococcoidia bacterium]
MSSLPTLIVFTGGLGGGVAEGMVAAAHQAITLDIIERAQASGAFAEAVVATDRKPLIKELPASVAVEFTPSPFHFGQRLREIIHKYHIERPFYVGGGAAPLLPAIELEKIARELAQAQDTVIANNYFSSDMVAFTPGSALEDIEPPPQDNPLARLLVEAGLVQRCLPRSAATQFDVDTPTDLMILGLHPAPGPRSRACLGALNLDTSRLEAAMKLFADKHAQVLVAGRVGSYVWSRLEAETSCRVRLLSEERGLRADGREEAGEGHTILGFYLQAVGAARFFKTLAHLGDAALIDTRVLFHHLGLRLTQEERFLSDLGWAGRIKNQSLREFTKEALEAPIPVIRGG